MIQPDTPIVITMPAGRWTQVLALLGEVTAPHRVTDPLIREIHTQCMRQDRPDSGNVTALRDLEAGG